MSAEEHICTHCKSVMTQYVRKTKDRRDKIEWICRNCQNKNRRLNRASEKRMRKVYGD